MTKHTIVNILPKIWFSRHSGFPCEFRIKDRFMWTRPVLVHINPFHCVKTGLALPLYKYGSGALRTTLRNLISRMGKAPNLSREKRASVIALHQVGYSTREVGRRLLCSQSSVSYTIRRYDETGNNDNRRRSGRPRASTPRDDQYLCRIARRHRFMTARMLQAEWEPVLPERVSVQTVRNRLVFLLAPEKPFNSCQLMKYQKDTYI